MDEPASDDPSRRDESSRRDDPSRRDEPVPETAAAPADDAGSGRTPSPTANPELSASSSDSAGRSPIATAAAAHWSASLPPAPFVEIDAAGRRRMAPLSPRVAVLIGAAIVLFAVLWLGRDAVRPFLVGLLLVYLLDPPVRWLVRARVPRPLAILLVYVVVVLVIVEFLNLTLSPLIREAQALITDLPGLLDEFDVQLQRLAEVYAGLNLPPGIRDAIDRAVESISSGQAGLDPGMLLPVVSGAGGFIGALFGYLILPVWAFYILKDRVRLLEAFDRALPAAWRPDVWATLRVVERVFGQWVRGQLLLGLVVGVTTFAGLTLLSALVDPVFGRYAVLLSIVAGVLELLPIIGPIIAAVPAVLLAATAGLEATVAALVLYTAIQQLENYLLVPKIQGDAVQLHPAVVIFALIVGGSLAGLLGAILALPVTAAVRDVIRYLFRRLSPPEEAGSLEQLGRDLGIEPPPEPATA